MRDLFKNDLPDLRSVSSVIDLTALDVISPGSPGYRACARSSLIVRCHSVSDVVQVIAHAAATGRRLMPRGGGHCFVDRRPADGIVADLSGMDRIAVDDHGVAAIGAGANLAAMYATLHEHGRTIPAGCGDTVGIAGLTLGGGIGLLGRQYGLTCDRLVGAQVVLADRSVVECDEHRESDLFWALRGAGGGQFGIVTEVRFATVPEPSVCRIEGSWTAGDVVQAWQDWAPGAPDGMSVNLTVQAGRATLFGASTLPPAETESLLREFTARAGVRYAIDIRLAVPYSMVKPTFSALDPDDKPRRARSEFFARTMTERTTGELLQRLTGNRRLAFTAMGGAYNRVAEEDTAFAHRGERFLLEEAGDPGDPWVDEAWSTAHAEGSGRVYPNFPDLALQDPRLAYHAGNHPRLAALKKNCDPHRLFDFPQAL
ncbi:FAD-binding oxidoreductase [Amycolatopsis rubida]|uniref:Berberine and berberine like n=1 Tax=Amycolatopsis rubida TaxID=112413 RepID=A0A1I5U146_9PSEU|nr:FAD-dependent oxidoreductase [Amycolatopsis rubida]SFP89020.1 Berberine and berberine like [Amycolatopsis rubida]